jgi:hypothetical protein
VQVFVSGIPPDAAVYVEHDSRDVTSFTAFFKVASLVSPPPAPCLAHFVAANYEAPAPLLGKVEPILFRFPLSLVRASFLASSLCFANLIRLATANFCQ